MTDKNEAPKVCDHPARLHTGICKVCGHQGEPVKVPGAFTGDSPAVQKAKAK